MTEYLELLYLILFTGILAVGYSYLLSGQILAASAGNARMQEIAEAMQELEQFDLQAMTMEGKEATLPAATPDIR